MEQQPDSRTVIQPGLPAQDVLPPETIARLGEGRKAIIAAFGILKGKGVFPEDSLKYQLELRAEWD
jgi:hypothetical protein